ncbi:C-type lectin domain family 2 member D-like isoform X2 [Sphaerodactylus townsendi]|uniref:C-type lectin domain family 2 member D-like isoform X2 n=1 Tax=Sphaerodactylus townsendi TaxID=933632 RepID=UPI0020273D5F|nr:C-type lectin domain family 2 member D-like isoform X2 [Sphaerodactylus townsendi]
MGDSSRPVTAEETEVSAEGVCEKHGEDVHLFCMEDQIPLCAVRRESKAHELHTEIPREQTASMKYQGTGSSRSGWKEELRPSTSGDSNITSDSKENGTRSNSRIQNSIIWIVLVVFTIQIVGLVTTILVFTMAKTDVRPSVTPTPCCPHGWIMSQGRCFHFLDLEGGWDAGQQHCSSLGASLAVIDNFEKLNQSVAVHHKGPFNHWVGLLRQPGESWKWPDGTAFNNQFEVGGDGPCAYLNNGIVSSTDCSTEKKYLCSQRARQERSPGHCRET